MKSLMPCFPKRDTRVLDPSALISRHYIQSIGTRNCYLSLLIRDFSGSNDNRDNGSNDNSDGGDGGDGGDAALKPLSNLLVLTQSLAAISSPLQSTREIEEA